MRKWIFLVFPTVILLALIVADQAAKGWAESKLAERAAAYYPPGSGSSASIRSFPFIPRLLFTGEVPRVAVNLDDLQVQAVLIRQLSIRVSDVKLDRDEVFRGRVHVRDVGQGTIVVTLDGPSLARAIGADVRFTPAGDVEMHERIQGVDVKAKGKLTVKGNVITVTPTSVEGRAVPASRFAINYRIPGVELLPCQAEVKVTRDTVVLSCNVVDIPAALVQIAQSGR
ncbi:MAG: LmeA family phospholipid-binding protein [Acidimicrobiia bacterium]